MRGIVIPARGGSKGLPLKNLRPIGDESLVSRCVRICRQTGYPVWVSTDHGEIMRDATKAGAEYLSRPKDLARDETATWDVIRHAVKKLNLDSVAYVQCTAPFVTVADIHGCFQRIEQGFDLGMCVHSSHVFLLDGNGRPINCRFPIPRRQDFEPQWAISGSVWAANADYVRDRDLYSGTIGMVESEFPLRLDIDTEDDLKIANMVARSM